MQTVAKFEKVSFDQFEKDVKSVHPHMFTDEDIRKMWENVKLPTRATSGSAGYDFYAPYSFCIDGDTVHVVTGIRCKIEPGWFLMCCPKSGLGFKFGMRLSNTIGIIDSDYYASDNEGHIHAKFTSDTQLLVGGGEKFMQGIFLPYGITTDDKHGQKSIRCLAFQINKYRLAYLMKK